MGQENMTPHTTIVAMMTKLLLSFAPPVTPDGRPGDVEAATPRYREFAQALVTVAYDPDEQVPFQGAYARLDTLAMMTAIVTTESHMDEAVLSGRKRGDRGRSVCATQMNIGRGLTQEGWSADQLVKDPTKCIAAGLHAARRSMGACRGSDSLDRLSAYASGNCRDGRVASRLKMNAMFYMRSTMLQHAKKMNVSLRDDDIMAAPDVVVATTD